MMLSKPEDLFCCDVKSGRLLIAADQNEAMRVIDFIRKCYDHVDRSATTSSDDPSVTPPTN